MPDFRYPGVDSSYPAPTAPSSRPPTKSEPARRAERFQTGPMSFRRPDEWKDVTVFAAMGPATSGSPIAPMLRVGREAPKGPTLRSHADRLLLALARDNPSFELVHSGAVEVAGQPGISLRCRVTLPLGRVEQTLVMVAPGPDLDAGVFTFNASASADDYDVAGRMLDDVLRSVHFEGPTAAALAAPVLPSPLPSLPPLPSRPPPPPIADDFDPFGGSSVPMPGQRTRR